MEVLRKHNFGVINYEEIHVMLILGFENKS